MSKIKYYCLAEMIAVFSSSRKMGVISIMSYPGHLIVGVLLKSELILYVFGMLFRNWQMSINALT
jgi:hypothetical protein